MKEKKEKDPVRGQFFRLQGDRMARLKNTTQLHMTICVFINALFLHCFTMAIMTNVEIKTW